jgi:hypothetical protein
MHDHSFASPEARRRQQLIDGMAIRIRRRWFYELAKWNKLHLNKDDDWFGVSYYPRLDGGKAGGRNYVPFWPKVAAYCLDNKLDADDLIAATFYNKTLHAPFANQMTSAATLQKYHHLLSTKIDVMREKLNIQQRMALAEYNRACMVHGFDRKRAWKYTLLSESVSLSPLYRYVGAKLEGLDDVADIWRAGALEQYLYSADAYDKAWGDLIPEDLRSQAREFTLAARRPR